jgi:transcriptional regulator with XRE-family HTH domain
MNRQPPSLGSLLRSVRARNEWTLKQMSAKTGIPLSTLAKVEHDRLTLGYDKLLIISRRLNMSMSELFAGEESESRGMARRSVGTMETAVRVVTQNYEYFFLCPELRKKRMIPLFARLRARTMEEFGHLVRHEGEEFLFVLTGRIEVHTEFYEPITLEAGQCVYIDSNMGHAYLLAAGCDEASAMGGCSSVGDALLNSLTGKKPRRRLSARPTQAAPSRSRTRA